MEFNDWKNSHEYIALKSFFNFNNATIKEVVHELKLQYDVDNVIRFCDIDQENQLNKLKKHSLVIKYSDGGTLQSYLKKYFDKLTWKDKFNFALQLTNAVLYLHDEGIIHCDLQSINVLYHQNIIKLADFQSILWKIFSGKPSFYTEGKPNDIDLSVKISQGLKETIVPNSLTNYTNLDAECWPQAVEMISVIKKSINNYQTNTNNLLCGELSQLIDTTNTLILSGNNKNNLLEKKFEKIVDQIVDFILKLTNEGKGWKIRKQNVLDYFNNHNINLQDVYNWLLNNQFNSNSIFLFGYFNYSYGIGLNENNEKAFNLFIDASEQNHILAQYYVGLCYQFGDGTVNNEKLAFEYYKRVADKDFVAGEFRIGYFYKKGIGTERDTKLASYWYEKAVSNGNTMAMHDLALMYQDGDGIEKDYYKAFELFKKSAEEEYIGGITMLGYCYDLGMGINVDKKKAFELYQKAANLEDDVAQHNLAVMYNNGDEIKQDIDQAIYWYKESAKQGYKHAQYKLENLRRQYRCPPKLFFQKT